MMNYYLSLEAENDLEEIWIFGLDNWGLKQADDYHGQLISMCRYLSENPLLGKSQDYIAEGLRSYPCGSHRLFYMVSNDCITVVRILHQSMDTERHIQN